MALGTLGAPVAAAAGLGSALVSQTVLPSRSEASTWHVLVECALGNIQQYRHSRVPRKLVLPSAELTTEFPCAQTQLFLSQVKHTGFVLCAAGGSLSPVPF